MSKVEPFRYRFQNPGIKPMDEDLWFESHQELLLNVVNTNEGRGLLCINKSFDHMPIVGIGKDHITGFMDIVDDKVYKKSEFRAGATWGNIIRHRWPEFQKLAREHYSHKKSNQCRIRLHNEWLLAATTTTWQPEASPAEFVCDGYASRDGIADTFANVRAGAGNFNNEDGAGLGAPLFYGTNTAGNVINIRRGIVNYNTASIPDDDVISSADHILHCAAKANGMSGENSDNSKMVIMGASPAYADDLVDADYNQSVYGTTEFGRSAKQADIVVDADHTVSFNGDGLSHISKTTPTSLGLHYGWDFDNTTAWLTFVEAAQHITWYAADWTDVLVEPRFTVVHSSAGARQLINGGLINNRLIRGRLIG